MIFLCLSFDFSMFSTCSYAQQRMFCMLFNTFSLQKNIGCCMRCSYCYCEQQKVSIMYFLGSVNTVYKYTQCINITNKRDDVRFMYNDLKSEAIASITYVSSYTVYMLNKLKLI